MTIYLINEGVRTYVTTQESVADSIVIWKIIFLAENMDLEIIK